MFQRTKVFWRQMLGRPDSLGNVAVQDGIEDRRIWYRFPADLQTAFKPAGAADNSRLSARVRNISLGGINLLANRAFEPGDLLSVELPGAADDTSCNVLACVVHCVEEGDDEWSLGCTFSRELTQSDLESLGAKRERQEQPDQRQWKRFPCTVAATYQLVATEEQKPNPAQVLNVSPTGVGLMVDRAVENGTLLSVELHNAAGTTARTMLACVVHVNRQSAHQWALGCNFIRSLSEEDLQALLEGP